MPQSVVDAFERQGFIWGGKWNHYDTMHFEYRPEFHKDLKVDCGFHPLKYASLHPEVDLREYFEALEALDRAPLRDADH